MVPHGRRCRNMVYRITSIGGTAPANSEQNERLGRFTVTSIGKPKEGFVKSAVRTAAQVPVGRLEATGPGLAASALQLGLSTTPQQEELENFERIGQFQRMFPGVPVPESAQPETFAKNVAPAVQAAQESFPTVGNIARGVENVTGLPLTPQNEFQEMVRMGSSASKLRGGGVPNQVFAGVTAPVLAKSLTATGLPNPVADALAYYLTTAPAPIKIKKTVKPTVETPTPNVPKALEEFEPSFKGQTIDVGPTPGEKISQHLKKTPGEKAPQTPITPAAPPTLAPQSLTPVPTKPKFEPLPSEPVLPSATEEPEAPKPSKAMQVKLGERPPSKAEKIPGKVTKGGAPLGLKIAPVTPGKETTKQKAGEIFSKDRVYNPTQGGKGLKQEIAENSEKKYSEASKLFDDVDKDLKTVSGNVPNLTKQLNDSLQELKSIPDKVKSAPEKQLQNAIDDILNNITVRNGKGQIVATAPMNALELSKWARSLGHQIDFDFAHGQPKGIFKNTVGQLKQAIKDLIKEHPEIEKKYLAANKSYSEWAQTYNNDYVRPFLDKSNQDYEKLYRSTQNPDELNMLKNALNSPLGEQYKNAIIREFVEKEIAPFTEGKNIDSGKLDETLRRLESVITPQQAAKVKDLILEKSPLRKKKISQPQKELAHKIAKHKETVQEMRERHAEEVRALKQKHKEAKIAEMNRRKPIIKSHEQEVATIKQRNAEIKAQQEEHKRQVKEHQQLVKAQEEQYKKELEEYAERNKSRLELEGKLPEQIDAKLNTLSGIREIRNELSKTTEGKELWDNIAKEKAADIITNGKIAPSDEAMPIQKMLTDKDTLRLLNELMGPEWTNNLKNIVEEQAKLQEALKEAGKQSSNFENVSKVFDFFLDMLRHNFIPNLHQIKSIAKLISKENLKRLGSFAKSLPKRFPYRIQGNTKEFKDFIKNWEDQLIRLSGSLAVSDQASRRQKEERKR